MTKPSEDAVIASIFTLLCAMAIWSVIKHDVDNCDKCQEVRYMEAVQ